MNPRPIEAPVIVITPARGWSHLQLRDLWEYRELVYFLVWREVKVRYKQTFLGAAWAIIQPVFTMLIFSLFFGRLAKVPSDGIPYSLFAFAGLVPWTFFSNALSQSSNSLITSSSLISKVYFPRLAIPLATVLSGLVDFMIAFALLLAMAAAYGRWPTTHILFVLPLVLLTVMTAMGAGLWLSALNVEYRDVRYAVPFLTQFWMFATPIVYPSSLLHEPWRSVYALNPMVGVIEGFRWALLGSPWPGPSIMISAVVSLAMTLSGAFYFRRMERSFADVI